MNQGIKLNKDQTWEDAANLYHRLWLSAYEDQKRWRDFVSMVRDTIQETDSGDDE
jgi:hypothetical protein